MAAYKATQPLEGSITHFLYGAPKDRSAPEVFRNYEAALKSAGFETLFASSKAECGPRFTALINPAARYNGLIYGGEQHFLAAKRIRPEGDAYVPLYITSFDPEAQPFILLVIIEVAPMEERVEVIEATEMEARRAARWPYRDLWHPL